MFSMKSLFLCYLVSFLLSHLFAQETQTTSFLAPREAITPHEDNKKMILDFYRAMTKKDLKTIYSLLSENYTMKSFNDQSVVNPCRYDSFSKNLDARIKALHNSFPDFKIEVMEMISEGKKTLALVKLTGKHKGSFLGLEPTEKSIIIHIMSLFSIESGVIIEIQEIWNELDVMKQLGHILLR